MKQQIAVAALYLTGLTGVVTCTGFLTDGIAKLAEIRIITSDILFASNCIGHAEYAERIEKATRRAQLGHTIANLTPQPYVAQAIDSIAEYFTKQSPS